MDKKVSIIQLNFYLFHSILKYIYRIYSFLFNTFFYKVLKEEYKMTLVNNTNCDHVICSDTINKKCCRFDFQYNVRNVSNI